VAVRLSLRRWKAVSAPSNKYFGRACATAKRIITEFRTSHNLKFPHPCCTLKLNAQLCFAARQQMRKRPLEYECQPQIPLASLIQIMNPACTPLRFVGSSTFVHLDRHIQHCFAWLFM